MSARSAVHGALALAFLLSAPVALADPAGKSTTSETIRPASGSGYVALQRGPGESYRVRRHPSARPASGRASDRRSLAFFAQLTDPQIADEMSPARVDFLDPAGNAVSSSWRPMEAIGLQVFDSIVRNVNANRRSALRARGGRARLGFAVTTGDLADNQQLNETRWFKGVLDGGRIDPFSGQPISATNPCGGVDQATIDRLNADVAARRYTGVADYDDYPGVPADRYNGFWDPDVAPPGTSPYAAFPRYPGFLERAQAPFSAEGLRVPWYISRGNHDGLIQGNAPASTDLFRSIAVSCQKVFPSAAVDPAQFTNSSESEVFERVGDPAFITQLLAGARPVPPDPDRRIISTAEYKKEIGNSHGYGNVAASERRESDGVAAYYSFRPRAGIEMVSLDTVAEGGGQNGNLDDPQYKWLERTLRNAQRAGRLIIVYGHHTLATMSNTRTDEQAGSCEPTAKPGCDADPRRSTPLHRGLAGSKNVRDLFLKYPNVIAYVAGHTHANRVDLFRKGRGGFWQINTASHIDWPQQSRLVELMDNRDGTLSLFATLLDHAAPITPPAAGTVAGGLRHEELTSIGRVLAWNDPQRQDDPSDGDQRRGRRDDRNVELVLNDPRASKKP